MTQMEGVSQLPEKVSEHLESSLAVSNRQIHSVRWEIEKILEVFTRLDLPLILLKGSAYVLAGLPNSRGRLFSDVDLLVRREKLELVEEELKKEGWLSTGMDEYDEKYFREWIHEIPPLRHNRRNTTLDVHHTILPLTAKYSPNPEKFFERLQPTEVPGVFVFSPEDMVIHSATHLIQEGEFEHGLRDIVDLHYMLDYFSKHEPEFWGRLVPRAIELDLIRPLYYGVRYAKLLLETQMPKEVIAELDVCKPMWLTGGVMDFFLSRALMPNHPSCNKRFTGLARLFLFVRSHYLKMPLRILLPHLARKAWKRHVSKPKPLVPVAEKA